MGKRLCTLGGCQVTSHINDRLRAARTKLYDIKAGKTPTSNGLKEQCPKGHPYNESNTLYYQRRRYCRRCRTERKRADSRRRPGPNSRSILYTILYKRDKGLCRYCGATATEVDHVIPKCNNGDLDSLYNLVMACHSCNQTKGREGGFTMSKKRVLRWQGQLVAPDALFGAPLMEQVKEQRLRRQARQGLTHLVDQARKEKEEVHHATSTHPGNAAP